MEKRPRTSFPSLSLSLIPYFPLDEDSYKGPGEPSRHVVSRGTPFVWNLISSTDGNALSYPDLSSLFAFSWRTQPCLHDSKGFQGEIGRSKGFTGARWFLGQVRLDLAAEWLNGVPLIRCLMDSSFFYGDFVHLMERILLEFERLNELFETSHLFTVKRLKYHARIYE